jgi:hypothetical protein
MFIFGCPEQSIDDFAALLSGGESDQRFYSPEGGHHGRPTAACTSPQLLEYTHNR